MAMLRSRTFSLLFVCSALGVGACTEEPVIPADTGVRDAGPSGDGATPMDSGTVDMDAAVSMDGGTVDSGTMDMDGSATDGDNSDGASSGDGAVSPADVVARDTRTGCVPGAVSCATADRSRVCLDDGGFREEECPAGRVCAEGRGCVACEPGARRCSADGLAVEECNADGTGFAMMSRCDPAMGQVCDGFRCVDLCARAASQRSYLGCEYWPTSTPNPLLPNQTAFQFAVTIANPQLFAVRVTISGGGLATPRTVMVPPNTTQTEALPWVSALSTVNASALVRNGAYRLVTSAPVAVYQFSPLQFQAGGGNSYTNDASLLLPTHVLTNNYSIITHGAWSSYGNFGAIVGTQDATTVRVGLRANVTAGTGVAAAASGSTVMYTLNRGDVLLLTANGGNASCSVQDLTGSEITSSAPVAVFGGHVCTQMPCGSAACDHLEEQLFPAETWGSNYVVSGLRERGAAEPSVVRILSRTAGNTLTFTGIPTPPACATLNAGQYCEFQTVPDFQVRGTAPLLIAQFMVGEQAFSGVGDPAMVLEVPTQQFRTNYVFNVPASYTQNFVTTVYPTGMPPRLDGNPIAAGTAVAGTMYSVSRFALPAGSHRMTGTAAFGIKVSGTASFTSYMYPGGLDLNQLTAM